MSTRLEQIEDVRHRLVNDEWVYVSPVSPVLTITEKQPIRRDNPRGEVLATADSLVNGDRNVEYGDPNEDFRRTSIYWSTHAGGVLRRKIAKSDINLEASTTDELLKLVDSLFDPHDVAIMMVQLKNSRLAWSPEKKDNWIDSAGYSACGYDCTTRTPA